MAAGDDDWDLSAVVRSCNSASSTSSSAAAETALSCLASLTFNDDPNDVAFAFSDIFQPQLPNAFHELHQAFVSFLPNPTAVAAAAPEIPNRHLRQGLSKPILDPVPAAMQPHYRQPPFPTDFPNPPMPHSHVPKSRKRKNQQKRTVCHVTADNLSTDMWAWRKYGQKPIKGSPYPRNYYRCSSSKGCGARKQVERSNADPDTFIITYTGDHTHPRPTHRNSLAGSSRNRSPSIPNKNPPSGDHHPNPSSPPAPIIGSISSPAPSPITPLNDDGGCGGGDEKEGDQMFEDMTIDSNDDDDYDDDDILIPNLTVRDEIFVGFEELGYSSRRPVS